MGGANVAVANDVTASYWNPAAYGFFKDKKGGDYGDRSWSGALGVGAGAQVHEDLGEEIDKISKIDFNNLDNGVIQANRVSDYITLLNELKTFNNNKDRALTASVNGVAGAQVGNFGIGGYVFGEISARGDLDLVNISPVTSGTTGVDIITQLSTASNFNNGASVPAGNYYFDSAAKTSLISTIAALPGWNTTTATNYVQAMDYGLGQAQASGLAIPSDPSSAVKNAAELASAAQTGGSFADNNSRLLFKGMALGEVPLTWGRRISDNFSVGANLKYMKARVYNTSVKVFNTDFGDALDRARNDYKDSHNFGVDLGMLYRNG
ncbi:MAG: conjugal transfer protein TraF, partial [Deltaproteobacteria bacterium]|nr:conjugal transfer protein TraF [Deltaproteobacteria bacterium]